MERHLPYVITECYLPPDTGERVPTWPQPDRPVLDLPTSEGWKAELTWYTLNSSTRRISTSRHYDTRLKLEIRSVERGICPIATIIA